MSLKDQPPRLVQVHLRTFVLGVIFKLVLGVKLKLVLVFRLALVGRAHDIHRRELVDIICILVRQFMASKELDRREMDQTNRDRQTRLEAEMYVRQTTW